MEQKERTVQYSTVQYSKKYSSEKDLGDGILIFCNIIDSSNHMNQAV